MSNLKVPRWNLLTGFHVIISGVFSEMSQLCCPILQRRVIIKKPVNLKSGVTKTHETQNSTCFYSECVLLMSLLQELDTVYPLTQNYLGFYHTQRSGVIWYYDLIPVHQHNWSIRRIHLILLAVLIVIHL